MNSANPLTVVLNETLSLRGGHVARLQRNETDDLLEICTDQGVVALSIRVTEAGPELYLQGAAIRIRSTGELSLEAEHLRLRGNSSLSVESGEDLAITAAGDVSHRGRTQTIESSLGDVRLRANDDIRLNGERVFVNCDDPRAAY